MFQSLSERLQSVFSRLSSRGRLTEKEVDEALREVRLALLEADVSLKVVKSFVARVHERALDSKVLESLSPAQQVVKVVDEELREVLGGGVARLAFAPHPPTVIMLAGLQGSGKTTTAAKLALHLRRSGHRPLLVAADVRRPAAVAQLVTLGKQLDVPVHSEPNREPPEICRNALKRARELAADVLVLDTAGRLHVDAEMMDELVRVRDAVHPTEVLLVADAMTGQDAVRVAEEFHRQVGLTGLILTKTDGDARGGAALSMKSVTGVPIKYLGTGEKSDALEPFHPDRLASRILGMGDMLTLIDKTQEAFTEQQARKMEKKLREASFDLEDFLEQLQQLRKMGPLTQVLSMVPGLSRLSRQLPSDDASEQQLKKVEAVIFSMTPEERRRPEIIDGSRRRRIARGSGTTPQDINQLLNQFRQMQKMMKTMGTRRGAAALSGMFR